MKNTNPPAKLKNQNRDRENTNNNKIKFNAKKRNQMINSKEQHAKGNAEIKRKSPSISMQNINPCNKHQSYRSINKPPGIGVNYGQQNKHKNSNKRNSQNPKKKVRVNSPPKIKKPIIHSQHIEKKKQHQSKQISDKNKIFHLLETKVNEFEYILNQYKFQDIDDEQILGHQSSQQKIMKKLDKIKNKTQQLLSQYQSQIKELRKKLAIVIAEKQSFQNKLKMLQSKSEKQPQKHEIPNRQQRSIQKCFFVNILQDEFLLQKFLVTVLKKICGQFRSTKLIYNWNPLSKGNIHQFIDNKSHLLFLIHTQQDYHIAAYTEQPFKKPFTDIGIGAIISLTNQKAFLSKPNQRAISHDDFYIQFGNSELLIKGNQVSSNLGATVGYYQSGKEKADILLGLGTKSATKISALEVFQLVF